MNTQWRRTGGFPLFALAAILGITAGWWALALWPVSGATPEWLARTRAVCFGIYDDGLPDAGGWIGLIGQPVGMLAVLFIGWGGAVLEELRALARSRAGRPVVVLAALLLGTGVASAVLRVHGPITAAEILGAPGRDAPSYPRLDRPAPPLRLVDQKGETITLDRFHGRPVLLGFAYAHCETICPLLVRDALAAQDRLREAGDDGAPSVVVITLDPWRDTPARLPAIAGSWGLPADAHLLGGSVPEVEATLAAWNVTYRRDERTGEVTHPALVYVLDAGGRIAYATNGGTETLVELVGRL